MTLFGKWIDILCFKHDGKLHRKWDRGFVVFDDENFIAVAAKRAKVVETDGRKWFTKEPAVTVFSKKHWFNVICMFKTSGICYYCNIASPTVVDNKTIKYIDYDLDWKLFPNGDIKLLDEHEYQINKKRYSYSDDLDTVLRFEADKCKQMMINKTFPFNDERIKELFDVFKERIGL